MKNSLLYTTYLVVSLGFGVTMSCAPAEEEDPTPPNILFIMSDDHAYQAVSAYGHGLNQTPNIDRIAEEGAIFTRATVTNSICAPRRADRKSKPLNSSHVRISYAVFCLKKKTKNT